jgi:hypothetical protein
MILTSNWERLSGMLETKNQNKVRRKVLHL